VVNKVQIASQIRFHLDQLSAKNAHHDFEHLCRHLARERICSNIIPSTGPVSAGGDLGKDFETFTTYLRASPISDTVFIRLVSEKPIVFACSTQKRGIDTKIKSDIDKILQNSLGVPVETIFFFCVADISIAKREELKSWSKTAYSVKLEIIDGQALSEMLSDRDVFWIAVQYLQIPSDIYPRAEEEENWYTQVMNSWSNDKRPQNYADFVEIKSAARHAKSNEKVKQDLPRWINLLKHFVSATFPSVIKQSAIYEIAVMSFRGFGTLIGQEVNMREYFAAIPHIENIAELEDAAALLNYCVEAIARNQVGFTIDEINSWHNQLVAIVEQKLCQARTPNQKCPLLEIRGYLALHFDLREPDHFDRVGAIKWWTQMIKIAKDAPLFPLERFSDRLTAFTHFLGSCPGYDYLTQQTDVLLTERSGDAKAAEKCRDRAVVFIKMGQPLKAIDQLHKAKVNWFSAETIKGSLLSMLVISQSYQELGLNIAAKYYALAAATIAFQPSKPELKLYVPKALFLAALCDYAQGSWAGYEELTDVGLASFAAFGKQNLDSTKIDEFEQTLFNTSTIIAITSVIGDSELQRFLEEKVRKWNLSDWLDGMLQKACFEWKKRDISEIWQLLEKQLWGRPFGDLGKTRVTSWQELGVTWVVSWDNNYAVTPLAEQLIAVLQIILADIADVDLCLLKTSVEINVSRGNADKISIKSLPSNKGRKWEIIFPNTKAKEHPGGNDLSIDILTAAISVLNEISLLPQETLNEKIANFFKNGLSMKAFVAKPYEELYRDFITEAVFNSINKAQRKIPQEQREFKVRENSALSWKNGPGPGYSKKNAEAILKKRYRIFVIPIRLTLKELGNNEDFMLLVKKLRQEGWLDWHLLSSISNVATSYRFRKILGPYADPKAHKDFFINLMKEPEKETSLSIPISEFSEKNLRFALNVSMVATISNLGLEVRQRTPDLDAIDHFLRNRYNYWTDDIDHENPFST
jgi:hypothetical protein